MTENPWSASIAKPRPEKKRERKTNGQHPLPLPPRAGVVPREPRPADGSEGRESPLVDETGEWKVVSRPYTSNAGEDAHAGGPKVSQPGVTEFRTWGAHERISVKRASAEGDKR